MAGKSQMNRTVVALVVVIVLVAAVAIFLKRGAEEQSQQTVPQAVEPAPRAQPEPVPDVEPAPPSPSVPAEPEEPPPVLPALDESDPEVSAALTVQLGRRFMRDFMVPESILRKSVVTLDNLPGDRVAMKVRAIRRLDGKFLVAGPDDALYLDPDNYARYASFVRLIAEVDPVKAIDLYARWYPLLQQLYVELGYPGRQFNDRVIEVIDDLLVTPEVTGTIPLVRPHVLYEYADPRLEDLSGGQKVLLRMGPDHARVVKEKMRALRSQLVERSVSLQ